MCYYFSYFHDGLVFCSLMRNPVTHKQHYRSYVIYKLPQVKVLDFRKVKQKVYINFVFLLGSHDQ